MKRFILILVGILALAHVPAHAVAAPIPVYTPPVVLVSSISAASAGASITITTPTSVGPYSAGNYTYVSHLNIVAYSSATLAGLAAPITCTVTGLGGAPTIPFSSVLTLGVEQVFDMAFDNALQSTIGTNVTISCPASSSIIWNVKVSYYQGS